MSFEIAFPQTIEEAVSANENGARWFAGGTDLIPEIKNEIVTTTRLVNLKRVQELRGIRITNDGVHIGALTTLTEISEHETIRKNYRALAQACELAASPQIRNVATIGGNLNQDSRCAYSRNGFPCFLRGGDKCFMRDGENRDAAVIGYHDCVHVHPSDPANALVAFDAQIVVRGREGDTSSRTPRISSTMRDDVSGERVIAAQEFFRAPDANDTRMNVLNADEMITEIILPNVTENTRSVYVKAMDRAVWTFALASVALQFEIRDSKFENVRVVFGGVAPIPFREFRVEKALSGKEWNEELVTQGKFGVLEDAMPLAHNGYKIRLARGILKRALRECLENV